ncbi:hypothetical protein GQ53DRAFT_740790 [Thozetella sp. PMI_491]|nr:hypothetical protein GQ53DRAFT_740790 [Thozetella sp. PMI_491]
MASHQRPPSPGNVPYPYPEPGLELYQPEQPEQQQHHQHQYYAYAGPNVVKPPTVTTSPTISHQPYVPPSQAETGYPQEKDGTPLGEKKIMGLRRSKFWIAFTVFVAIAIIAALAGVLGASLNGGMKTSKSSDTPTPASSNTSTASQASSTSSSPPTSTPSITTVTGPSGVSIECPSADGLTYTAAGNKTFKRLCNYDFPFNDLYNITAMNMKQCIDSCAANSECIGVTWDYAGPQGSDNNFCFAKAYIGKKSAGVNLESAILLQ